MESPPDRRSVELKLTLKPKKVASLLCSCVLVLVVVSFANFLLRFYGPWDFHLQPRMFALNREANLPTWFQVLNLVFAAALAFVVAESGTGTTGRWRVHWRGLAFVMLFLSLDELASLHEGLVEPVRRLLDASGFFYFAWIIPGMLFVALFVLAYVRFLWDQPARLRNGLILSGAIFVAGAIGVEGLSALFADSRDPSMGGEFFAYFALAHLEEFLEMAGIVLFNCTLLQQAIADTGSELQSE